MVNRLSMYSRSKLDYSQFKNETSGEHTLVQVEAKADELYSETLKSIGDYRDIMESLKDVLMERYVLTKDSVFELLEQHLDPAPLRLAA
jgi:cell division protease FtsH